MMKKPIVIIVGAIFFGIIGAWIYLSMTPKRSVPSKNILPDAARPNVALLRWDDPAGFSFSYPEGIVIDKHDEDTDNYAHIEMTNPDYPGSIVLLAKDLPRGVSDTASWIKKDPLLAGIHTSDTMLGVIAAKKALIEQPEAKMVIGAVADGLLFYMETTGTDQSYWLNTAIAVTESFVLSDQPPKALDPGNTGDESFGEEEILE